MLLALDDRGAQFDTHGRARRFISWLPTGCTQVHNNLPTIVTSNWTEREFAFYHSRIASRLKAAVHVHIAVPDTCGKVEKDDMIR